MGWDGGRSSPTRAATRCSRWATARWPRRSSARRDERRVDGDLDRGGGRALPLLHRRARALHGTGDLDGGAGRARLGHRAGVRRVHALPRRARLHGALDGAHPPLARPLRRVARRARARAASCSTGSCRAACTRTCAPSPSAYVRGARASTGSRSAARSARTKEQMREVVGWALAACPTSGRGTCSASATWTTSSTRSRRGIDTFDCATPTRLARHGTALVHDPARRWRLDLTKSAHRTSREPIDDDCPCPACREHTRAYLHYLTRSGELTAQAAAHAAQPHLHGAADERPARGDRRGRLRRRGGAGAQRECFEMKSRSPSICC